MVSKKHEVHLVTKGVPNDKVATYIQQSGGALHTNIWDNKWYVEKTAPQLATWINNLNPDIYLISASGDIGWVALPLLNPSIATLTIGHTDSETFYLPARHYHTFLTGAIGVSPQVAEQYHHNCGIDENKIDWIPYGVDAAEKINDYSEGGTLRLVYAGRIEEGQKRISDLGKIINKLSADKIDFAIKIIGDGPEMPGLKETLADEIGKGKVTLTGWLPNNEVARVFQQSEIFLLTSAYEGFCIALTEAMANGCCPIVTNIRSGNSKLIQNDENGVIKEIGDVNGFAEAIKSLQNNRTKLFQMRNKAWQTGCQYGKEKMIADYENSFEKAIKEVKANPRNQNIAFPVMETCRSKYPFWLRNIKIFLKSTRA